MAAAQIDFTGDRVTITRYPFRPGSCSRTIEIASAEIEEVDVGRCVLRVGDELIYLPGWPREALARFCTNHGIAFRDRYDVWADILDPFVDTSFSRQEVGARNDRLRAGRFSASRVIGLRFLYFLPIAVFQGIAGEWTGLHHYHLLEALRALRLLGLYRVVYRHTMNIALEPYNDA